MSLDPWKAVAASFDPVPGDTFEHYWHLTGSRYNAANHKERARHAYEAGKNDTTPPDQDFWLERMTPENIKEDQQ